MQMYSKIKKNVQKRRQKSAGTKIHHFLVVANIFKKQASRRLRAQNMWSFKVQIVHKEPRSLYPNFLDVAFLGVYRKLREEGG